ncbi:hypothetical protein K466DRAFT_565563 [Polyporus arcularius HHB13444]|uniref:phosphogluconate dehydrogenase (NADP(+)-dependent, decarboxylating) n=1 Tax=Polyporus arcularius HHB13444 TaxID=1314778 RepID=A0A5C3PBM0_9APHY|nr:hypothetical protein K466DRAFT_565563 [Polyporus arcularius HHB13444]
MDKPFEKIGIVGAGSMGGSMAMLFAENSLQVSVYDVAEQNIDSLSERLKDHTSGLAPDLHQRVAGFKDLSQFMDSLGGKDAAKLLVFSIPHGSAADEVIAQIRPHLSRGDIILDGGNEVPVRAPWAVDLPERRQGRARPRHAAAAENRREGREERQAVRGEPGPAGCGHYVKMVHNGIEQGILGVIFKKWEDEGEPVRAVSPPSAARVRKLTVEEERELPGGHWGGHMRSAQGERGARTCGKVVQDADDTEGTGIWSVMEAAKRHVSAPTIASAHFFRIASADRAQRMQVVEALGESTGAARKQHLDEKARTEFIEDLRLAVYCATLVYAWLGSRGRAAPSQGTGLPADILLPVLDSLREDIAEIRAALAEVHMRRMVGGSLLIIYEADWECAREGLKWLEEADEKEDGEDGRIEQVKQASSVSAS